MSDETLATICMDHKEGKGVVMNVSWDGDKIIDRWVEESFM